jgi:MFS family permease
MAPSADVPARASSRTNFFAFLASMFLSKVADQVLLFMVPLVVFQTTQSAGWAGLAFALESFPRFIAFPVCGHLCDRHSPVRLLRWSQVCRAAACAIGALCGGLLGGVGWLIGLSALCGVLTTQGMMAREVILPQAFPQQRFEQTLAWTQAADQVGAVLGPVFAALLLSFLQWPAATGITALVFLLADAAMHWWWRTATVQLRPPAAPVRWTAAMHTALGHVLGIPALRRLVVQAAGVNLVVGVTLASSAALVTGTHAQSTAFYGALQAAGAAVTVAVLMGIAQRAVPVPRLGVVGFALVVAGGLLTALQSGPWGYAAGYLLVIGFDKMFNIYMRSARQRVIPASDYGKTTGVMTLLNNLSQPLSGLALGAFASGWGIGNVILALTLVAVLLGGASLLAAQAPGAPDTPGAPKA